MTASQNTPGALSSGTEQILASATPPNQRADLATLLEAQRADFLRGGLPSAAVRRDRIDRLILLLTENIEEFSEALHADFGNRPRPVSLLNECAGILPDVLQTRQKLTKWLRPQKLRATGLLGLPTTVEKKPLGVVGIIGPWNNPVGLTVEPVASAFAAGNRVMTKMSEVTPRTSRLFADKASCYFDATEFAVITGGPDVGAAFSALPFDHIFFTGSPSVGALVAATAAKNLVPVTLELGGKNPAVVDKNADVSTAAKRIMAARIANGGQICLCPDYALVPRREVQTFVDAALDTARTAAQFDDGSGLVSLVDNKNYQRVTALIDDARRLGAVVADTETPYDATRRRIPPTIILGVTDEMVIAREEVFGPVLTVLPYDSLEEACEYITKRPAPLAAYWYGPTGSNFDYFRTATISGGISVNDFALHSGMMAAPFGGIGRSGWGAYHGKAGFDTFTHHQTVTRSRLPISITRMMTPPYSTTVTAALSGYIRLEAYRARRRSVRATPRHKLRRDRSKPI